MFGGFFETRQRIKDAKQREEAMRKKAKEVVDSRPGQVIDFDDFMRPPSPARLLERQRALDEENARRKDLEARRMEARMKWEAQVRAHEAAVAAQDMAEKVRLREHEIERRREEIRAKRREHQMRRARKVK